MTGESHHTSAVVDSFISGLEKGDIAQVLSCYAPEATVWHNFDQKTVLAAGNAAGTETYFQNFSKRDYVERRIALLPNGALLQFLVDLESTTGKTFTMPGCIVFEIDGDKIVKLEEYIDISSLTAAMS